MIVGTTLLRLDGNPYFSPEFSRGGLAATFVVEVMNLALAAGALQIDVEHRNSEDTTWSSAGSFSAISSTGAFPADFTGLMEIIRLRVSFTGTAPTDAAHFLIQAPSWRPYS